LWGKPPPLAMFENRAEGEEGEDQSKKRPPDWRGGVLEGSFKLKKNSKEKKTESKDIRQKKGIPPPPKKKSAWSREKKKAHETTKVKRGCQKFRPGGKGHLLLERGYAHLGRDLSQRQGGRGQTKRIKKGKRQVSTMGGGREGDKL